MWLHLLVFCLGGLCGALVCTGAVGSLSKTMRGIEDDIERLPLHLFSAEARGGAHRAFTMLRNRLGIEEEPTL